MFALVCCERKECILHIKGLNKIVKQRSEQMKGMKQHLRKEAAQPGHLQKLFSAYAQV